MKYSITIRFFCTHHCKHGCKSTAQNSLNHSVDMLISDFKTRTHQEMR